MENNSNIEGCVVVTGAASGIGRSICNELDKRGFRIALWDIEKVLCKTQTADCP